MTLRRHAAIMDGITHLLTEMQDRGLLDESTVKAGLTDWDWALDDLEREAVEAARSTGGNYQVACVECGEVIEVDHRCYRGRAR